MTGSDIEKNAECCKLKIFSSDWRKTFMKGRKLEPFGEVCAGPSGHVFFFFFFLKEKKKINK